MTSAFARVGVRWLVQTRATGTAGAGIALCATGPRRTISVFRSVQDDELPHAHEGVRHARHAVRPVAGEQVLTRGQVVVQALVLALGEHARPRAGGERERRSALATGLE